MTEADHYPNQFTVEYLITEPEEGEAQHQEPSPLLAGIPLELVEFATPRIVDSTLDADHNDDLVARYWRMDDLVGGGEPPRLATRELEEVAKLHAISADEPNTLAEAGRNPCWMKAMQERDDIHHREPDMESGGYASGTPSNRAQMGLQTEAQRKRRSCEA